MLKLHSDRGESTHENGRVTLWGRRLGILGTKDGTQSRCFSTSHGHHGGRPGGLSPGLAQDQPPLDQDHHPRPRRLWLRSRWGGHRHSCAHPLSPGQRGVVVWQACAGGETAHRQSRPSPGTGHFSPSARTHLDGWPYL